jgi:hypothetical protein
VRPRIEPEATVHKKGSNRSFPYTAAGGLALLVVAWSSPGLAAAHAAVGCDRTARELQSLDVGQLRVAVVDLSDVSGSPESDNLTESVAPLLFLTPRVASILEDVFGDSDDNTRQVAKATPARAEPEQQSSPVVGNASAEDRTAPVVSPMYEHAAILPRFQRQMYRTDI